MLTDPGKRAGRNCASDGSGLHFPERAGPLLPQRRNSWLCPASFRLSRCLAAQQHRKPTSTVGSATRQHNPPTTSRRARLWTPRWEPMHAKKKLTLQDFLPSPGSVNPAGMQGLRAWPNVEASRNPNPATNSTPIDVPLLTRPSPRLSSQNSEHLAIVLERQELASFYIPPSRPLGGCDFVLRAGAQSRIDGRGKPPTSRSIRRPHFGRHWRKTVGPTRTRGKAKMRPEVPFMFSRGTFEQSKTSRQG